MWNKGALTIDGMAFEYCVKHYDEESIFGIDEGKISKLRIKKDGQTVCSYERGWDEAPTTETAKKALKMLLKKFN